MNATTIANVSTAGPRLSKHLRIISDFLADRRGQGFASATVAVYQAVVEACATWMVARGQTLFALDEVVIDEFLHRRLARSRPKPAPSGIRRSRHILGELLLFLRQRRLVKPRSSKPVSATERLIAQYDQHLEQVCGQVDQTRRIRRHYAQEFLETTFSRGRIDPRKLAPSDVRRFIERRATELQTSTVGSLTAALRSFLKFLNIAGLADERLIRAVACPAPALRNPLPQPLSKAQLRMFFNSFDRRQPVGRRDFAMALCLCRLGLRAREVANLELQDLNWQDQTLHLRRTKSRRDRLLPLPPEVAQGLAEYLRDGRPDTSAKLVFARHRVPRRGHQGVHLVISAIRRGFVRAGLGRLRVHQLRYTFATQLHRRGVDLKRIADLLGHRVLDTTARYARVDFEQLRQASLPWPKD